MPYLIGPNSVAMMPNMNSVANMIGTECSQKPIDAERRHGDLDELHVARDDRLVEAVGHLPAEAGQEEERPDENRGGERHQRARRALVDSRRGTGSGTRARSSGNCR